MKYPNIREEELKNKVAADFFDKFDCTDIIKNIDFAVKKKGHTEHLLWAEAKAHQTDIFVMLAQLILTIGKARTYNTLLPPPLLGCFDCEKIAFVPYFDIQPIFYQNDFNWNVTPSNHETKEFKQLHSKINEIINGEKKGENTYLFDFEKNEKELKAFIKENFVVGKTETTKIQIDKNNFVSIYIKWLDKVKPTIAVDDWDAVKKAGIIDGDFYLADLLSAENKTLKEKLFVILQKEHYELERHKNELGFFSSSTVSFIDKQKAHTEFWAIYERPPKQDYWEFMTERRDLLVPQDIRERKGSFFTPQRWVELSQKYIAKVFGENWQDEFYVWDCAAGTGNLLAGLTNKYNIWASTLDKADVDVMHDRIDNGANLLKDHCFQFDFLNDDFGKLPKGLQNIINNENERKKLIIYINPPYAEATNTRQRTGTGENKTGVSKNLIREKYKTEIKNASNEIFAQFLIRACKELQRCKIANFAKLKALCAFNFAGFRTQFGAKLESLFVLPADTFDNVSGQFPIGFHIWDTDKNETFKEITADVYDKDGIFWKKKNFCSYDNKKLINDWMIDNRHKTEIIDKLCYVGSDFQNQNKVQVCSLSQKIIAHDVVFPITEKNLIIACIYFTVRKVIAADWLNDRDQFLYPNNGWQSDTEFHNDCLAYTLFHNSNNIQSSKNQSDKTQSNKTESNNIQSNKNQSNYGTNHWIPFNENEVGASEKFDSRFMSDFIAGKLKIEEEKHLFDDAESKNIKADKKSAIVSQRLFSREAQEVFNAGRELWRYYHKQKDNKDKNTNINFNVNASYYNIREYFQGRNEKGRMNTKSSDAQYNELLKNLRDKMKILAKKIEPKIYEYGFLQV